MACIIRRSRTALLGTAALAALLGAQSANAQDAALPGIQLDVITVVPSKTEETATDALASVSIVGPQQLERLQATTPSEIFFGMPGVVAASNHSGNSTAINIRGLQDFGRVAVIIDGARQNFNRSQHGSQSNFWIEPELLEQVTVVRGPVSNIYGSGAIGGVVVFETKSASDFLRPGEDMAGSIKSGYESNGEGWLVSGTAAARFSPNFEIIGNVVKRDRGEYQDGDGNDVAGSDFDVLAGFGKATIKPAEFHELNLGFVRNGTKWTEYTDADPTGSARDSEVVEDTYTASYEINDPSNPWVDFHASAYLNRTNLDQTQLTDVIYPPTIPINLTPIQVATAGAKRGFDVETVGFDIYNSARFNSGALKHTLTIGGDWFKDDATTFDEDNASDLTPGGERSASGAFVQDKIEYSDWFEAQLALRYDTYSLESDDVSTDGDHLSPRVSIGISPFERSNLHGIQVYGTYAQGYRAPSVTETLVEGTHPYPAFDLLPNPALLPEVAETWEVGLNLKRDGIFRPDDGFRGKVAVFRNDIEDYIEIAPIGDDVITFPFGPFGPPLIAFAPYQYVNIAEARIRGIEFETFYDAGDYFLGASGSALRGDDVGTGLPLQTIPADQVTMSLGFRMLDRRLTIGGEWQIVSSQYRVPPLEPDEFPQPTPSYQVINLFASYEANDRLRFDARLNNLTDQQYRVYPEIVNSEGFNAKIAATVRFGHDGTVQ